MAWFSAPLDDDMWSQAGLFKSDKEYKEDLIKTKEDLIKEAILNALNTCDGFETTYFPGGGSVGIQTVRIREVMQIITVFFNFQLDRKH